MNKTTDTHRLYTLLALVVGVMLLSAGPAAAGTDLPAPQRQDVPEVDGWIYGRGAATYDGSATSDTLQREDGWIRGGGRQSLSEMSHQQRLPVDGWAIGQGMRSQTVQRAAAADEPRPATAPSISTVVFGLVAAGLLGAVVAVMRNQRHAPSAH